jgi:lysophospholipase L1-like esterase
MTRWVWLAVAAAVALVASVAVVAVVLVSGRGSGSPAQPPLPASMASVGDSVTRAFDLDAGHLFQDAPAESWSTGSDPVVGSHYDRIVSAAAAAASDAPSGAPPLAAHAFNDAESGAKVVALAAQLARAASQRVEYVTVLIGANDLCTSSVATMTPTATFQAQFAGALAAFFAADPAAQVFVASIPDLFQLWDSLRSNPLAQATWTLARICPAMLSLTGTAADRAAVVAQERADNAVLQASCARFTHCRFDANAVYHTVFGPADVSSVDYFHPSLAGQQKLAAVTWAAGFWPSR